MWPASASRPARGRDRPAGRARRGVSPRAGIEPALQQHRAVRGHRSVASGRPQHPAAPGRHHERARPAGPGCRGAAHGAPGGIMTPTRTRMTASQRREMVLQAALIEFAARGLDGTSIQDIAQRPGSSQPCLFRLFPAKRALFLSQLRQCLQQVAEVLAAAAADQAGEEALQAIGSAFGQLCKERTLPLMRLHASAASTDPEMPPATSRRWVARRDRRHRSPRHGRNYPADHGRTPDPSRRGHRTARVGLGFPRQACPAR